MVFIYALHLWNWASHVPLKEHSALSWPSHCSPVGTLSNNLIYINTELFSWRGSRSPSQELVNRGWLVDFRDAILGQRLNSRTLSHMLSENIDFKWKLHQVIITQTLSLYEVHPFYLFCRSILNRVPGVNLMESTELFISANCSSALSGFIIKGKLILR